VRKERKTQGDKETRVKFKKWLLDLESTINIQKQLAVLTSKLISVLG